MNTKKLFPMGIVLLALGALFGWSVSSSSDSTIVEKCFNTSPVATTTITVYSEFEKCKKAGGNFTAYSNYDNEYTSHCRLTEEIKLK